MDNMVFIIGSGRSGTTWLHLMLGSHPLIATGQESQLFNNYFASLVNQWKTEINYPKTDELRFHGISSYLKETEFYQLLQQFARGVFEKIFTEKPQATYFLEKSPNNSHHIDTIHRCFPNAKFIHVIRDGRDVAASIMAAKKSWGKYWAFNSVEEAILDWKIALESALEAKKFTKHYLEVRYEDLLTNGVSELEKLFQFLEISVSQEEIQAIYDSHQFKKLKNNDYKKDTFINPGQTKASGTKERAEPKDFFRKGVAGDWKNVFSNNQLKEIYWTAGDLLHTLGYADKQTVSVSMPLHLRARRIKQSLRKNIAKFINKLK